MRDSIERDCRELALPQGRRVGRPGHEIARRYLSGRLSEIGLRPFQTDRFELPFEEVHPATGESTEFVNLAAIRSLGEGRSPGPGNFLFGGDHGDGPHRGRPFESRKPAAKSAT